MLTIEEAMQALDEGHKVLIVEENSTSVVTLEEGQLFLQEAGKEKREIDLSGLDLLISWSEYSTVQTSNNDPLW